MLTPIFTVTALALAAASGPHRAADAAPLRVFISADMEGIAGVVNAAQLGPGQFEYEAFRRLMTAEVNAAIDGALAAGATQITVADSHGNGLSLLPVELNPRARLIRSWPRPLGMMEGVDGGFDAALLIGYHASINTPGAVRAHTLSSRHLFDVRLNGTRVSEGVLSAAVAGHFGVPVVLVSGDDTAVAELQRAVGPGVAGVVVKRAIGYHSADNLSPEAARAEIRAQTQAALAGLGGRKPFALAAPVRLEVTFKNMIHAEVLALLPNVDRVDGATAGFTGRDVIEVVKFLTFVTNYGLSE